MRLSLLLFLLLTQLTYSNNLGEFNAADQPAAPDYSNEKYWSALPFRMDKADATLKQETWISDSLKDVDVFYIYPTLYMKGKTWCADPGNKKLNNRLDKFPVKYHCSIFNRVARVYAPRYRQAIIQSFFDTTGNGRKALDFAYEDIKNAFEYYLKNYNHGRPIIIVSHSQGTTHARRLLQDYFDTPEMKKKLVCAYVVGFGIYPDNYKLLTPCTDSTQLNCYVTWASFKDGYIPTKDLMLFGKICVNPVSWTTDTLPATGHGGVFLKFDRKNPFQTTAHIKDHYLWVKTKLPIVKPWKVLHLVDFNMFWFDIRRNAALRVDAYLKQNK